MTWIDSRIIIAVRRKVNIISAVHQLIRRVISLVGAIGEMSRVVFRHVVTVVLHALH